MISNIAHSAAVVTERINRLLPENAFEFIITSSSYMFRKPNRRIFDLALEKAELASEDVWYIGAIDLPYTKDKNILTVKSWNELKQRMKTQY